MFALLVIPVLAVLRLFSVGWPSARLNAILDAYFSHGTAVQGPAGLWMCLHTDDPGVLGTANRGNGSRRRGVGGGNTTITWDAAAGGIKLSSADILFAAVAGPLTEDFTHFSLWQSSTANDLTGGCWGTGTIGSNPIPAGEDFTISAGNLRVQGPVMA